ncbi:hypothetical protein CBL_14332 [Carabus blaptoides fortunei]
MNSSVKALGIRGPLLKRKQPPRSVASVLTRCQRRSLEVVGSYVTESNIIHSTIQLDGLMTIFYFYIYSTFRNVTKTLMEEVPLAKTWGRDTTNQNEGITGASKEEYLEGTSKQSNTRVKVLSLKSKTLKNSTVLAGELKRRRSRPGRLDAPFPSRTPRPFRTRGQVPKDRGRVPP